MTKEEAIAKLDEFIKITKHDTPYYRGLVNGMILAKSILTGEDPTYFGPVWGDKEDTK